MMTEMNLENVDKVIDTTGEWIEKILKEKDYNKINCVAIAEMMKALALLIQVRASIDTLDVEQVYKKATAKNKVERNLNWVSVVLPKDCHNVFVCADKELFEERQEHGMKPLYDSQNFKKESSIPCFIGYVPISNLKSLDKLVGLPIAKQDKVSKFGHCNHEAIPTPNQELDNGRG